MPDPLDRWSSDGGRHTSWLWTGWVEGVWMLQYGQGAVHSGIAVNGRGLRQEECACVSHIFPFNQYPNTMQSSKSDYPSLGVHLVH